MVQADLIDRLFKRFGQHLEAKDYLARVGQIVDATIVSAPKQHNSRDENGQVKAGRTPQGVEEEADQEPAKGQRRTLDQEAESKLLGL